MVKAIASGQRIYPKIVAGLGERVHRRGDAAEYAGFRARMQEQFSATVESVRRLSPSTVELTVRAPLAARHFKPGQFFRLQNFETHALLLDGTALQTEALALAGARVDADSGRVSLMVMEYGASARLVGTFRPGDPVLLMGPTGVRAKIPGVARPCSSSAAGRAAATICPSAPPCAPPATACCSPLASKAPGKFSAATNSNRRRTRFSGRLEKARRSRRAGRRTVPRRATCWRRLCTMPPTTRPSNFRDVDRLLVIGGAGLVRRVRDARRGPLGKLLSKNPVAIGSANSVMQCMLKGVCAQCLQWQIDPATGLRTQAVFACSWQDEPIDIIDLDNLDERLAQNRLQEHLTNPVARPSFRAAQGPGCFETLTRKFV